MDNKSAELMKIVKETVKQGVKPYVVITRTGSTFTKEAKKNGLKDGDFYWDFAGGINPIKPVKNAITIFDLRE